MWSCAAARCATRSSIPLVPENASANVTPSIAIAARAVRRRASSFSAQAARNASTAGVRAAEVLPRHHVREDGELVPPALDVLVARGRARQLVAQVEDRALLSLVQRDDDA
jgi:hypothetical protein